MSLCSLYFGIPGLRDSWLSLAKKHAKWLGLEMHSDEVSSTAGRLACLVSFVGFGCKGVHWVQNNDICIASEDPSTKSKLATWENLLHPPDTNRTTLGFNLIKNEIRLAVPLATPEHWYYAYDDRGFVLSNDMRHLIHWVGLDLDEVAVGSLIQMGCISPPRSLSKRLNRVPWGHSLRWSEGDSQPEVRKNFQFNSQKLSTQPPEQQVTDVLDEQLRHLPDSSTVFFSGGVDSGLIATRLHRLKRNDVRLLNFVCEDGDADSYYASKIAKHLDLNFTQEHFDPASSIRVLANLGREYSMPFADFSTLPTNLLVQAAAECIEPGTTIVEGTGADGAFGMSRKIHFWKKVFRFPTPLRILLSKSYKSFRLWSLAEGSRLEHIVRVFRHSVQHPYPQAVMAQNPLEGIAYNLSPTIQQTIEQDISRYIETLCEGMEEQSRLSLFDIVFICAGQFAPKSYNPLIQRGLRPVYPFLEPKMLALSYALPWDVKATQGEDKAILKRILSEDLPSELIYRKKSGFAPPMRAILADAEIQHYLRDVVLSTNSPVAPLINRKIITKIVDHFASGQSLSAQTCYFMWSLISICAWLEQCEFASERYSN